MCRTATPIDKQVPCSRCGEVAVCFDCGSINEFDQQMQLRILPAAKCSDPALAAAVKAQRGIRVMRGLPVMERPHV
jgi:hypothetical protein